MSAVTTFTDEKPTIKELQILVGGHIEITYLNDGSQMIVNADALLLKYPKNKEASMLKNAYIAGNVAILKGEAKLT